MNWAHGTDPAGSLRHNHRIAGVLKQNGNLTRSCLYFLPQLEERVLDWQSSPASSLNSWFSVAPNWAELVLPALQYLAGESRGKVIFSVGSVSSSLPPTHPRLCPILLECSLTAYIHHDCLAPCGNGLCCPDMLLTYRSDLPAQGSQWFWVQHSLACVAYLWASISCSRAIQLLSVC